MAFTDPLSLTIAGAPNSLPRVETSGRRSLYQKSDGLVSELISHENFRSQGKERVRSLVQVEQRAIVVDPLSSVNDYDFIQIQVKFNRPLVGFTATQLSDLWAALKAQVDAAFVAKIFGNES